jgi:hypothetical protein
MTPTQQEEILNLRALSLTPKQIARNLGIKVSEVNAAIQHQAQQSTLNKLAKGELNQVYQCLASENLVQLLPNISLGDGIQHLLKKIIPIKNKGDIDRGLGMVLIAREARYNQIKVCSYLLDVWCLGVKDAMPSRTVDRKSYQEVAESLFHLFPGKPQEITLAAAQGIIFSACEYAESLGFKPHRDFEEARSHIGEWDRTIRIECGHNGKPFYVSGPYDNPQKIIETLNKSVGEGNFEFMAGLAGGKFE